MLPIAAFYWDPQPEIFTIPILQLPIFWYGLFFAAGFAIGFPLFHSLVYRFFLNRPDYIEADLVAPISLAKANLTGREPLSALNGAIEEEKDLSSLIDSTTSHRLQTKVDASRCFRPKRAMCRLILDTLFSPALLSVSKKAMIISDRITMYMIVSTVIGARLGHFIFYERPSSYLSQPWEIFRVWEGGLASHGAAVGIVLGLVLFARRYKRMAEGLTPLRLLDFVCVPTAFAAGCIRIGNFFNQEILGTPTDLPWGVVFGHPMDRSFPLLRHPVQLYEAFFYFFVFILLWRLSYRPIYLLAKGRLIGIFLILVFGFRFFIEFFKTEQSFLLSKASYLTMGQILSVPAMVVGCILLYLSRKRYTASS